MVLLNRHRESGRVSSTSIVRRRHPMWQFRNGAAWPIVSAEWHGIGIPNSSAYHHLLLTALAEIMCHSNDDECGSSSFKFQFPITFNSMHDEQIHFHTEI